jgi:hypothetical protein
MALHVFVVVFLLVVCLLLCLARLGRLDWFLLRPSDSREEAKRSTLHRLLKPRCPDDCPPGPIAAPLAAGSPRAATRARGQPGDATLPATNPCHGSRENPSTMDGARYSLAPCRRFPLERTRSQTGAVACCGEMGKVPPEELGASLTLGREGLSGLPHHQKPARNGFGEGWLIYPPCSMGVPPLMPILYTTCVTNVGNCQS